MPTRYKGPVRETRALDAFIKLMRAAETLTARLQSGVHEAGLTPGQLAVLEALLHLGPLSQRDLGEKLLRSGANVCTVIDNLEKAGHVQRQRNTDDRRVVTVSLTKSGKAVIEKFFPAHAARIATLMSALAPDEQDQLGALCKKLGLGCRE